jgi:hypothetical protein
MFVLCRVLVLAGGSINENLHSLFVNLLFGGSNADQAASASKTREDKGAVQLQRHTDAFVFCTWGSMECLRIYNERFHLLTAQNLRIATELHTSSVMCRLGMQNNFTVMGIAVVVADCMGKMLTNVQLNHSKQCSIKNMYKSTSVGFDNVREVVDLWRTSYRDFSPAMESVEGSLRMVSVCLVSVVVVQDDAVLVVDDDDVLVFEHGAVLVVDDDDVLVFEHGAVLVVEHDTVLRVCHFGSVGMMHYGGLYH